MNSFVTTQISDGVATISFERTSHLNAYALDGLTQLQHELEELSDRDEIQVVVLTGRGASFSAGAQLTFLLGLLRAEDHRTLRTFCELTWRVLFLIRKTPQFTLALVNGLAVDGGLNLALACDSMMTTKTALMGYPFSKLGLHPDVGTIHLLEPLIGRARIFEWLLSGRLVTATEALSFGLTARVVEDPDKLRAHGARRAREIAKSPAWLVRNLKRSFRDRAKWDQAVAKREIENRVRSFSSADFRSGMKTYHRSFHPALKQDRRI